MSDENDQVGWSTATVLSALMGTFVAVTNLIVLVAVATKFVRILVECAHNICLNKFEILVLPKQRTTLCSQTFSCPFILDGALAQLITFGHEQQIG